jgi:hypothetical protein
VPALATRDSARGTLVPSERQCFGCHEMQKQLAAMNMDPAKDPHNGTCGMCHNPHRQTVAGGAKATCASSGCHADWRKTPFHSGMQHGRVGQDCTLCHLPHQARVDPSDCSGCHQAVRGRSGQRIKPPVQFDTTRVRRGLSALPADPPKGKGDAAPPSAVLVSLIAALDSFPHDRHTKLACLTCHKTREGHGGGLTFAPPRGCQICHHQEPATSNCATCHRNAGAQSASVALAVAAAGRPARERTATFRHAAHEKLRCAQCHDTPVSLAPSRAAASCSGCHESHHDAGKRCDVCHGAADPRAAHARLPESHVGCDNCHAGATIARLLPDRSFCLTCHQDRETHEAGRECTTCHFLGTPGQVRPLLRKSEGDG